MRPGTRLSQPQEVEAGRRPMHNVPPVLARVRQGRQTDRQILTDDLAPCLCSGRYGARFARWSRQRRHRALVWPCMCRSDLRYGAACMLAGGMRGPYRRHHLGQSTDRRRKRFTLLRAGCRKQDCPGSPAAPAHRAAPLVSPGTVAAPSRARPTQHSVPAPDKCELCVRGASA